MPSKKLGPSGGSGGAVFTDDLNVSEKVKSVRVRVTPGLATISAVQLIVENGTSTRALNEHGGSVGTVEEFFLDDDEFITEIRGRYGLVVDSVEFETSKQLSHRFGGNGGNADYIYQAPDGFEIVGFHGKSGLAIDALGVIMRPRRR
jgi:hypothetical protein